MGLSTCAKIVYTFIVFVIVVLIICGIVFGFKSKSQWPNLVVLPPPDKGELIHITTKNSADWGRKADDALRPFKDYSYLDVCGEPPHIGCAQDFKIFNKCADNFGNSYQHSQPCIFLKFHHIENWMPLFYNDENNLPQEMPKNLKSYILARGQKQEDLNVIWISCNGSNPADVENAGPIALYPIMGFSNVSYPITTKNANASPLVAIFFERPRSGIIITIECRAWVKNFPAGYIAKEFNLLLE